MSTNNENTENQNEQKVNKFTTPRVIIFLVGIMILSYVASYVVAYFAYVSTMAFILLVIALGYFLYKKLFG